MTHGEEWEKQLRAKRRVRLTTVCLFAVLALCALLALCLGKYPVSAREALAALFSGGEDVMIYRVVRGLRLPRVVCAMICGAALAMSGAAYQGVFKNPLVSPEFLGVSQGACVGAAIAILCSAPAGIIQLLAFAGGLTAVGLTLAIPALMRSNSNLMLVLSGIIVGGVMTSVLGFLKYIADPETELATITYWQMGSFSYVTMEQIGSVGFLMLAAAMLLLGLAWRIDILSLGETEARTLGTNVTLVRTLTVVCATLLTASSVCMAGTIGWVGLVIPHFGRMIVGNSSTKLIPAVCLVGAVFLLLVDTVTRLLPTAEMPISIVKFFFGSCF